MSLLLYTLTTLALLALTHRLVRPLSRGSALALYLLPFAFTGRALVTGRVYGPVDLPYLSHPLNWMKPQQGLGFLHNGLLSDVFAQMIPWRKAVQWTIAHGEWPLWNPFILSGDILAASGQPAAFSPFTLLACLLPVAHGLTYSAALAHFIAALGAFLLARELGCRDSASLVAAAGFTFSTAVALFILWPLGASWAFFPVVLAATKRTVDAPRARSAAFLTAALTLLLLAGHPETVLHVVFLGMAFGAFELIRARRWRAVPVALVAGALALGLSAIYLLPIVEAAPQTAEHSYRNEVFAKQDRGVASEEVVVRLATDLFPVAHARGWHLDPPRHLPPDSAAAGSLVLALAIYAVVRVRSAYSSFFFAVAAFGLLARAEWRPLARALQQLPLFDITLNSRFSFAAACALAVLAALGVEELCRRGRDRAAMLTLFSTLVVVTAGNLWLTRSGLLSRADIGWGYYKVFAEVGFLAIAALIVVPGQLRVGEWRIEKGSAAASASSSILNPSILNSAVLVALVLAQRVASDGGIYHSFEPAVAYPPVPIFEPMKQAREPFRIVGHGGAFAPGTSALYELEDVRGYQAMTNLLYADTYPLWCVAQPVWFNRVDDLTRPFLSFLNVRYAVTWDRDPPPPGWREVARQRGSLLLENTRVVDRAFVPRRVRLGVPDDVALHEMLTETDFSERAWVRSSRERQELPNGPGRTRPLRRNEWQVDMERPGYLVVSYPAWKGWRAYVDGRRVPLTYANHAFLALDVPQGSHRVRLEYLPRGFVVGRAISAATLAALLLVFVGRRRWLAAAPAGR